jgi:hypothetical protein
VHSFVATIGFAEKARPCRGGEEKANKQNVVQAFLCSRADADVSPVAPQCQLSRNAAQRFLSAQLIQKDSYIRMNDNIDKIYQWTQ